MRRLLLVLTESRFLCERRGFCNRSFPYSLVPNCHGAVPWWCCHVRKHVHQMGVRNTGLHLLWHRGLDLHHLLLWCDVPQEKQPCQVLAPIN